MVETKSSIPSSVVTSETLFEILLQHNAYYKCQKNKDGRTTPLVGYTGRYYDEESGEMLQYVGEEYVNMAQVEKDVELFCYFAEALEMKLEVEGANVLCGVPEGGRKLSKMIADIKHKYGGDKHCRPYRYVCPEKVVIAAATRHTRAKHGFVFKQGEIKKGDDVIIIDDVLNNFSTAGAIVKLINGYGGKVVTIAVLLNRSDKIRDIYESDVQLNHPRIPIISLVNKPLEQYRQNDLRVANDIKNPGIGVVWKPKENWDWLMEQMKQANL